MRNYFFLFTLLFCQSCKTNRVISFSIENNSNYATDTLNLYIQSKKYSVLAIQPDSKSSLRVKADSLPRNYHDFTIQAGCKLNNNRAIMGFYYSDLSGIPSKEYALQITDSMIIIKPK